MSAIDELACKLGRRDEVPNQELARKLAETQDKEGIKEIAANLLNSDKNVQSDCLKVLYETGYIRPELIADYAQDFLNLLTSKNNRMVWGAMIGLSTVAHLRPQLIMQNLELVKQTIKRGSVITVDGGIKTLSAVASTSPDYNQQLFPYLMELLSSCPPKQVPMYAEFISIAVNSSNRKVFTDTIEVRVPLMTESQQKRIGKLMKKLASR